jgi:glycine/D-amino acid oxidase-like deaminating enzyme/nitrite reductase/ring-hydroxylating ferredoxin subunit
MDASQRRGVSSAQCRPIWDAPLQGAFPVLAENLEVDVAVIGAGITGITTAALLEQAGLRIAVLEATAVGGGATGCSTGNLYATLNQYLHRLAAKWDGDMMEQVVRSRRLAIALIERNIRDFRLQCGFSRQPWVLYSVDSAAEHEAVIEQEYRAALKAGLEARVTNELPLPYDICRALVVSQQAQFDPLRYVRQLATAIRSGRCRIFEASPATNVDEEQCMVNAGEFTVKAEHIVMATHTPKGVSAIQTGLGPYREYAVAAPLRQKQLAGGIFWSVGEDKQSTRLIERDGRPFVMIVGERHKTGQHGDPDAAYQHLEALLQSRFDIEPPAFRWSAQQYHAADGLPYIGTSLGSSNLYLASGFGADGLVYGTLAAMIIADRITGKQNPFSELYAPSRFTPVKSAGAFIKENLNVAGYYVKDYIKGGDVTRLADVPRGEGRIVDIAGDRLAVYRDEDYQLHVLSPVCTHLKCIVHWNHAERSWDCPCHGSRFGIDGAVLEGPALGALEQRAMPPTAEWTDD